MPTKLALHNDDSANSQPIIKSKILGGSNVVLRYVRGHSLSPDNGVGWQMGRVR